MILRQHGAASAAAWIVLILLAGCATLPPPASDIEAAWQARSEALAAVNGWEIKGKLAVRTRERGGQVNMLWSRELAAHRVNLYGPLGGGRVILTHDADGATLRDNKRQTFHADNPEDLLLRVVGWRIPFGPLQYWVLGVPAPGSDYTETLDSWGRLATLHQAGWVIRYDEYRDFSGRELPRKLVLRAEPPVEGIAGDSRKPGRVEVKALIKRWQLSSAGN